MSDFPDIILYTVFHNPNAISMILQYECTLATLSYENY